ncbi:MAG: DNA recombination protein RmuC [Planctomycetota bacterium]
MTGETLAIVILGLALLVSLGVSAWALTTKAKAAAEADRLASDAERAESDHDRALAQRDGELERLRSLEADLRRDLDLARETIARSEERLAATESKLSEQAPLESRFADAFKTLSAQMLKESKAAFLEEAKPVFESAHGKQTEALAPIAKTLDATRERLTKLDERVAASSAAGDALREETARLTRALSRPEVRGQYGELQLRRVAELAGMVSYCDFAEQESVRDTDGALLRPDMVVKLPNERVLAIDAKCNTYAYLEAVNAKDDAEREKHLERFARHVTEQAKKLGEKQYWAQWEGSPEFVVMFVPGDHFVDAALSRRPELIETAAASNVVLASPSTLIGLLRAVAVGWREARLADEARELFELGRELHERAAVVFGHASSLGKAIQASVERYNKLVGSIDTRLVPTLTRFEEAGAKSGKALAEVPIVETPVRTLEAGTPLFE